MHNKHFKAVLLQKEDWTRWEVQNPSQSKDAWWHLVPISKLANDWLSKAGKPENGEFRTTLDICALSINNKPENGCLYALRLAPESYDQVQDHILKALTHYETLLETRFKPLLEKPNSPAANSAKTNSSS